MAPTPGGARGDDPVVEMFGHEGGAASERAAVLLGRAVGVFAAAALCARAGPGAARHGGHRQGGAHPLHRASRGPGGELRGAGLGQAKAARRPAPSFCDAASVTENSSRASRIEQYVAQRDHADAAGMGCAGALDRIHLLLFLLVSFNMQIAET